MRKVIVSPDAARELRAAASWYSDREPGLGESLIVEVDGVLETLIEGAHRYPSWRVDRPYRRVLLHRFPYAIFLIENDEFVYVLAIAHRRRKPGYWLKRGR